MAHHIDNYKVAYQAIEENFKVAYQRLHQSTEFKDALWFAMVVVVALSVSHLTMVYYIAYHDIKGHWDAYSLKYQRNTVWTYVRHAPSFFTDIFFLLFPSLALYAYFYHKETFEPIIQKDESHLYNIIRFVALCIGTCVNNIINRLWAMFIHWVMHEIPWLYRSFHKQHHCRIRDFCAASSWQDTLVEFLLMEVLGVFILANLFNPLPWQFNVAMAVYNGVGGAIDHSGFYIPNTWIDGRYHWDHHMLVNVNFSEIEMLDKAFGTLKVWNVEPEYLKAPRLNKKGVDHDEMNAAEKEVGERFMMVWRGIVRLGHLLDCNFLHSSK